MKTSGERGFSLIEMMVAIVILASGVLCLAAGSLVVTRDLYRSKQSTLAAAQAQTYIDRLRNLAASTNPPCTASGFTSSGSAVSVNNVTHSWTVGGSGASRTVQVISNYKLAAGRARVDTLVGMIAC